MGEKEKSNSEKYYQIKHENTVHKNIRGYRCDQCLFSTASGGDLRKHVKAVHDNIRDFNCSMCNYSAPSQGQINKHVKRIHHKNKDKECQVCDFAACTVQEVIRHTRRVHLDKWGMKKYSCLECKYITTVSINLENHKKIHHERKEIPVRAKKTTPAIYNDK